MPMKRSFSDGGDLIRGSVVSPIVNKSSDGDHQHRYEAREVRNGRPEWQPYRPAHAADREREQAIREFVEEAHRRALEGLEREQASR